MHTFSLGCFIKFHCASNWGSQIHALHGTENGLEVELIETLTFIKSGFNEFYCIQNVCLRNNSFLQKVGIRRKDWITYERVQITFITNCIQSPQLCYCHHESDWIEISRGHVVQRFAQLICCKVQHLELRLHGGQ